MRSSIKSVLQQLIDWNIDLTNAQQFRSALLDVQIESDGKKIRRLLQDAVIEMKAYTKLQSAYKKKDNTAVKRLADAMFDEYGTDRATANDVIGAIAELVGFVNVSNNSAPAPTVGSIYKFAHIDWRVLTIKNNMALLISEEILEERPYNVESEAITWENCTLRKYLNSEFYNKLDSAKSAISETRNDNPNNPRFGTTGGNATTDKVFLLSIDEVCCYFGNSTNKLNNIKSNKNDSWIDDENNSIRMANYGNKGAWWWWLRSPGYGGRGAAGVHSDGSLYLVGYVVNSAEGGVRPALWLNLESAIF